MTPDITLYTMGHCPFCARAKALLRKKGITQWTEFDLEVVPEKREEMIARSGGRLTVPQIFIDDVHVGGSDDLYALDGKGGFDPLIGPIDLSNTPLASRRKAMRILHETHLSQPC